MKSVARYVRAELDAAYAHLYGLTRDELRYILDPADIYGGDFPSETFRVLKEREIRQHGEYRTAWLVLGAWDRLTVDGDFRVGPDERCETRSLANMTAESTRAYPVAISRVALIGSFNVLHSAVRFASRGRTRSFSQK